MPTIQTQIHLQGVHNRLLNKINSQATSEREEDARQLEKYLNMLKNPRTGEDPIWDFLRQQIVKTRGGRSVNNLFHTSGTAGGFVFEKEMGSLLQVLIDYMLGQESSNKNTRVYYKDENGKNRWKNQFQLNIDIMTGNTTASPSFNNIFEGVEQELMQVFLENGKNAQVPANLIDNSKYYNLINGPKFGKPDIIGKNMLGTQVFWDTTTDFGKMLALFNKYSFTLKNYSSVGSMWNAIQLGETDPYKAYYSVLSSLGYSAKNIYDSYFRARNCFNSIKVNSAHGDHGVSLHMSHIQNIYELIGMGMYFLDGSDASAEMLILNNSAGDQIFVRSTASMAKDFLETNGSYYGLRMSKKNPFEAHSSSIKGSSKSFGVKHTPIKIKKSKKK